MSPYLASTLSATGVDNSKVVSSSDRNDKKLAKSDFTKLICKAKEFSFLTSEPLSN